MNAATNFDVKIRVGTALTDEKKLLVIGAPQDFAEWTLAELVDAALQPEHEGEKAELANNVTNVLRARSWGGLRVAYAIEANGKPANPSDRAANYLASMTDTDWYRAFTIRVTKRDGGGQY